ncbi:hypothetical protein ACIQUM_33845 [Amycolatopsis azurea]|uniref:hypothetical protein n=1 Tax=Amycolatopsis azurea TaxID=36819 RepID=UPI00380A83D0
MSTINLQNVLRTVRSEAQTKFPGQFVQAAVDPERGTAVVYWHGKTPEEIRQHARSAGLAEAISYVEVPYSLKELTSEARRISVEYPYVVSAGPSANYQSIDVRVDDAKISLDAVKVQSSIPLNIIRSGGGGFVPLARHHDGQPYSGGTWITNFDTGYACSTGFSMTTSIGQQAISTAEHCREPGTGSAWGDPGLNDVYGYESRSDIATDSMLLLGQGITYGPVVYNGGWTSGSGYYVKGWSDPFLGDVTCDSGGLSGEVCGARVNATDTFIDGTGPGYITDDSGAHDYGSAGEGDSGGPNYNFGTGGVIAAGEIVAGLLSSEVKCSPGAVPAGRDCYYVIFHSNIQAINDALLAHPMTN